MKLFSIQRDPYLFQPVSFEERRQSIIAGESISFWKDAWRKLKKNKLAMASGIILTIVLILAIIGPMVIPYSYDEMVTIDGVKDKTAQNLTPFTWSETEQAYLDEGGSLFPHVFGTDELCRDYFVRVLYGTRVSLAVGIFASLIVLVIGVLYGSISGYAGGKVDMIMMRIVDIIYSLPDMLVIILLSVFLKEIITFSPGSVMGRLGSNMISLFIVYGAIYWVSMARQVRGQVLSIRENDFVIAAKLMGEKSGSIIRKHIIPNCLSVIIVSTALEVPSAIFTESYLSFIGLGVSAPMPSLGSLANVARGGLMSYPFKLLFPALMICLIVLSLNLLGEGLRDAFDPKSRR